MASVTALASEPLLTPFKGDLMLPRDISETLSSKERNYLLNRDIFLFPRERTISYSGKSRAKSEYSSFHSKSNLTLFFSVRFLLFWKLLNRVPQVMTMLPARFNCRAITPWARLQVSAEAIFVTAVLRLPSSDNVQHERASTLYRSETFPERRNRHKKQGEPKQTGNLCPKLSI